MITFKQHWRYVTIRAVATIAGDIAMASLVAGICSWLIEAAALGMFLSFLVWLLGIALALALSQYLVHPTVDWLLADDKLSRGFAAAAEFAAWASQMAAQANQPVVRNWLNRLGTSVQRWRSA